MSRMRHVLVVAGGVAVVLAVGVGIGAWGMRAVLVTERPEPNASAAAAATTAVPHGDGWVAWGARADGTPLRWDPCTTIPWVVRPGDPDWLVDVAGRALDEVGEQAGVRFRHVGVRDVEVGPSSPTVVDGQFAPVVVTVSTPDEVAWLRDDDRALAVPVEVADVLVTGQVLLHRDPTLAPDFSSRDQAWGATLLHEAGHLVGLDHVDDPDQLLFPYPRPGPAALADGDLRGLAALRGDGRCLPTRVVDVAFPTPRRSTAPAGATAP